MSIVNARRHSRPSRTRRNNGRMQLESLETRTLMSAVVTHAIGFSSAFGITHDDAGNVWVAGGDGLYEIGANGQQIGATVAQGTAPFDVAFDKVNQHLYFSDMNNPAIVEVGLDGTVLNTYTVPDPVAEAPEALTVATDGSVWFSTPGTQTSTSLNAAEIGRLDLNGTMTFATVNGATGGVSPFFMAASNDGTVWFGSSGYADGNGGLVAGAGVGHAHADSTGAITIDNLYAISTPAADIQQITVANDDSVWFALSPRNDGTPGDGPARLVHGVVSGSTLVQTEYVLPGATGDNPPLAASIGLDNAGRLWFTDTNTNHLSFMDTNTGQFTQLAVPSTVASPLILTITPTDVFATANVNGGDDLVQLNLASFSPPVVSTSPDIAATTGTPVTGPLVTFQTAENGPFTYSVDYGNGQTDSGGVALNDTGFYTIPANVTYAADGTYNTSVTITTADGDSITVNGTAVVTPVASTNPVTGQGIDLSGPEDKPLAPNRTINGAPALVVATFNGPVGTYSAAITWGDNTTATGQVVDLGGGAYAVVAASKTFSTNGTFTGSVVISGGPNVLTVGFTSTISDTPLVVSNGLVLKPLLGRIVLNTVATFTDDIDSTASWFKATITWGDGTTSQGLVVRDPGTPGKYLVIGLHLYTKKGTYNVLTLIDNTVEDVSATATASITIK